MSADATDASNSGLGVCDNWWYQKDAVEVGSWHDKCVETPQCFKSFECAQNVFACCPFVVFLSIQQPVGMQGKGRATGVTT